MPKNLKPDPAYELLVIKQKISNYLNKIEKLFAPYCKVTFLMRNPKEEDGDLLMTNDDLDKVIAAITQLQKQES